MPANLLGLPALIRLPEDPDDLLYTVPVVNLVDSSAWLAYFADSVIYTMAKQQRALLIRRVAGVFDTRLQGPRGNPAN